jgi:ABC-2 type transport system ATP-binding protein
VRSGACAAGRFRGAQKRRVDLALGLIGNPELIFLDEPTTGLDPEGRRQLWDVVRGFTRLGKTVILTTHYLEEAEALADRVGVIIDGRMVAVGPPGELGGREEAMATVRFHRSQALTGPLPPGAGEFSEAGETVTIETAKPTAVVTALAAWACANGLVELPGLTVTRPSLEDIYLGMVRDREANDG